MFSNTTMRYKCWLEPGTGMHIGLRNELHFLAYMLMCWSWCYCQCYVYLFSVLKLMSHVNDDMWMMMSNWRCITWWRIMNMFANNDKWYYAYLYTSHISQLNIMMYILTHGLLLYLWCLYPWCTDTQDEEL
jgi:hypothetical protein